MSSDIITVFVGDITPDLSSRAVDHDSGAKLITNDNYRDLGPGTYYTSIGDLGNLNQFSTVLLQADVIIYSPPSTWSSSVMKYWTEDYLEVFSCMNHKTVVGFDGPSPVLAEMSELVDCRRSDDRQIWIAGCSISHGVGVMPEERWGVLVAQELSIPVSFLTQDSSSLVWAADQILRSDVRSGDLIFWGLTSIHRFSFWNHVTQQVRHCTPQGWEQEKTFLSSFIKENFLASDTLIYEAINAVYRVSNFCDKIGAVLIIGTVLRGLEQALRDWPNFVAMAGMHGRNADDMFIDIGSDQKHPGRLSHRHYAETMLRTLRDFGKVDRYSHLM